MANLPEQSVWADGIYQIDEDDDVIGGPVPGGIANRQGKALADRTRYLKDNLEAEVSSRQDLAGTVTQQSAAIEENTENIGGIAQRVQTLEGRGGPVDAHDFGSDSPGIEDLTQYACENIWGAGGTWTWDAEEPWNSTYEIGGVTHTAEEIFSSTWVRNTFNVLYHDQAQAEEKMAARFGSGGTFTWNADDPSQSTYEVDSDTHYLIEIAEPYTLNQKWVLTNTPDTDPRVFSWQNAGQDIVTIANETLPGVVRSGGDVNVDPVTGLMTVTETAKGGDSTVLYDESKARNLLDVLGIRAIHSDDPATALEIASAMSILHQKINPDGIPDFSGLRLGDYLDLPSLNDGTTTYTWEGNYKNLRITIAGFNIYKHAGDTENAKNHIVFMFRNCPLTRRMNASDTNTGGYAATEMRTYLDGVFKTGLANVLGSSYLYTIRRLLSTKGSWAWESDTVFLPTEREIWGTSVWDEKDYGGGFQAQWPIFRDSVIWKIKRYNGARHWWWEASPLSGSAAHFAYVGINGSTHYYSASAVGGCAPAFCVL
jgi:hypothetical protein